MATLSIRTGRSGYVDIVRHVILHGKPRTSRGFNTYDAGHTTIEVESPYNALPIGVGRNLNRRIGAAEAVQLIGGFADPVLLFDASKEMRQYAEDDGHFYGAYGRRIGYQLRHVRDKLSADLGTRQAVISLWDPYLDNTMGKRDYPCTLTIAFSTNDHAMLEMDVTMRSSDVWRGIPYDMFQFTQLQLTLARVLKLEPGAYRHHTHSLHLYASDVDRAATFVQSSHETITDIEEQPTGFGELGGGILYAMNQAKTVAYDKDVTKYSGSESWYWHVLRGHTPQRTLIPPLGR